MSETASIVVIAEAWSDGVRRSIESATRQTHAPIEVVVVDTAGRAGLAHAALVGLDGAAAVRVTAATTDRPGASRNAGIVASTGRFIVCLDEGDELQTDFCAEAIRTLERDGLDYAIGFGLMSPGDAPVAPEPPARLDTRMVIGTTWCAPSALLFRRVAWDAAGRFDETLGAFEQYDFLLRLARGEARGVVLPRPGLRHAASPSSRYRRSLEPECYSAGVLGVLERHTLLFEADPAGTLFGRERLLRELVETHRARVARRDEALERVRRTAFEIGRIRAFLRQEGRERFEWGDAGRTSPVSRNWGYDRGAPVDRYYIEQFVDRHAADVRGAVLEVQENDLTMRAGGDRVTRSDVVDINPGNPRATIVGDLRRLASVPDESYDCIILTQTLHVIDDMRRVVGECWRVLKPGGVLLATLPCASRVCLEYGADGDFWRVTEAGARALFAEVFPPGRVQTRAFGNVQVIAAFLLGLAGEEIDPEAFEVHDPFFPLLVGVRAVKRLHDEPPARRDAPPPRRRTGTGAILMYHRVVDPPATDVHGLCVGPDEFARQMAAITRHFRPMPLAEFVEGARRSELPEGAVAVTFDDGYLDGLTTALPILEAHAVPATFFLTTERLGDAREFWWDALERALLGPGPRPELLSLTVAGDARRFSTRTSQDRRAAFWELYGALQVLPASDRAHGVSQALAWSGAGEALTPGARPMTPEEIRALAASPLVAIGAHGTHHERLPARPVDAQLADVADCKRALEETVGGPVTAFAYPYGAWSALTARVVRQAGFLVAVTCDDEPVRPGGDPWRLPRFDVRPHAGQQFERRLWAFLDR